MVGPTIGGGTYERGGLQDFIRDFGRFMAQAVQSSVYLPEDRANELVAVYDEQASASGISAHRTNHVQRGGTSGNARSAE